MICVERIEAVLSARYHDEADREICHGLAHLARNHTEAHALELLIRAAERIHSVQEWEPKRPCMLSMG